MLPAVLALMANPPVPDALIARYRMKYPHAQAQWIVAPQKHEISPRIQTQIETAYAWFYQLYYPRQK